MDENLASLHLDSFFGFALLFVKQRQERPLRGLLQKAAPATRSGSLLLGESNHTHGVIKKETKARDRIHSGDWASRVVVSLVPSLYYCLSPAVSLVASLGRIIKCVCYNSNVGVVWLINFISMNLCYGNT